MMVFIYC